jgi:hypothetical protein
MMTTYNVQWYTKQLYYLFSTGLLSDRGLDDISNRLGVEWQSVAIELNLRQAEIDQIKLDNPYRTVEQVRRALITWRDRSRAADKVAELLEALTMVSRNDLVNDLHVEYDLPKGILLNLYIYIHL